MNDVDIKALPDDVATLKALILNQAKVDVIWFTNRTKTQFEFSIRARYSAWGKIQIKISSYIMCFAAYGSAKQKS
jgi:hypothetical protein